MSSWLIWSGKNAFRLFTPCRTLRRIALSPRGDALAVKSTSGQITVLDPKTGKLLCDFENKKDGQGSNLAFSADGKRLVDGSWNRRLTIREARTGKIVSRDEFPGEMIRRVTHDYRYARWAIEHQPIERPGENMPCPVMCRSLSGQLSPCGTRSH
jgi:WD40 repeat protein